MKPKDAKYVIDCVDNEGFDYTFVSYSEFKEIKDEEFHKLREAFLDARQELAEFLGVEA
jgi:hypothetical protein